jgi:hypothetical protein
MICSSINLLFFMPVILHGDGLHKHYIGTAGRGQVITTGLPTNEWYGKRGQVTDYLDGD